MTVKQPPGTGEWKCGCICVCVRAAESTFCSFFRIAAMPTQTPQTPDTSPQASAHTHRPSFHPSRNNKDSMKLPWRAQAQTLAYAVSAVCLDRRPGKMSNNNKTNQGWPPLWVYRDWPLQASTTATRISLILSTLTTVPLWGIRTFRFLF